MHEQNRGTGVPPVVFERGRDGHATLRIRRGAYLPHWTCEGGIYFVTYRLADSLPHTVLSMWRMEREALRRVAQERGRPLNSAEEKRLRDLFSETVEKHLDAGTGQCWMKQSDIADLVENALRHFDGVRYSLLAWCVMPNHVHVVVKPTNGHELDKILHSWKSFTSHQAVKLLKIFESFWQPEYYDHLIRDDDDLWHAIEYTVNNPLAAGLRDWRWVGLAEDLMRVNDSGTGVSPVSGVACDQHGHSGTGVSPVTGVVCDQHGRDGHATETAGEADA